MMSLNGILAELGLAHPTGQPDPTMDREWTTEPRFHPEEGQCYELAFARIPQREGEPLVVKKVRADGPSAADWFDLDAQGPLDRRLYAYTVKAWRPLEGAVEGRMH